MSLLKSPCLYLFLEKVIVFLGSLPFKFFLGEIIAIIFFSFPSCNLPFLSTLPLWETKQNLLISCKTHFKDLTRFSKYFLAFLKRENPGRLRHLRNIQILLYSVLFFSYKGKLLRKGMLQKGHKKYEYTPLPRPPSFLKKACFLRAFLKKNIFFERLSCFRLKKYVYDPKQVASLPALPPQAFLFIA